MKYGMANDNRDESFSQRYAARRTRADDEVNDWITGPGQRVIVVVLGLIAIWFVLRNVVGLFW